METELDRLKIDWAIAVMAGDYRRAGELAAAIQNLQAEIDKICQALFPFAQVAKP